MRRPEKKRGESSQPGVWEYKIVLIHDDMNTIDKQASADSMTKRPEFGWISNRVPNKTNSGLVGKVRLEKVSHKNGRTDMDNESM